MYHTFFWNKLVKNLYPYGVYILVEDTNKIKKLITVLLCTVSIYICIHVHVHTHIHTLLRSLFEREPATRNVNSRLYPLPVSQGPAAAFPWGHSPPELAQRPSAVRALGSAPRSAGPPPAVLADLAQTICAGVWEFSHTLLLPLSFHRHQTCITIWRSFLPTPAFFPFYLPWALSQIISLGWCHQSEEFEALTLVNVSLYSKG